MIDVLLATTAAPTYFKPHYIAANRTTWVDGGLVCNNPSFEALYRTNKQFENGLVRILSMGNGQHPVSSLPSSYAKKIPLKWAVNLTEICMNATSEDAHARCTQLLHEDDYIRINAVLGDKIALHDCTKAFEILPALAHKQAKENRPKIIDWLT